MTHIFWKRTTLTLALIPVAILGVFAGTYSFAVVRASIANNQILSEYEQEFNQIPHPSNTSIVTSQRRISPPTGNGRHCFFFVGEVRSFSGDRSTIQAFYADQKINLKFFENQQTRTSFPHDLNQLANWRISPTHANQPLYLAYTIHTKIDGFNSIDLRC